MDLRENLTCMKNCLSNVAEIARNHDIFGPIDERIWDRVQAVSDFYTAFPGNIGKLWISVENDGVFTLLSSGKNLAIAAESFPPPGSAPMAKPVVFRCAPRRERCVTFLSDLR
ncbi:hypothetical protein [Agrobacterium radiobacter]|uniref:hypothetical protein n=2 Tax=Agrobacterium TaxID=357 RepID=UPI00138F803F|nr:hypothetical protein [Agrobacterium radiobacter]